jgi:hypothetical protein
MSQIINTKIVYDIGEEMQINGKKCICEESSYNRKNGRCTGNGGKVCVLNNEEPRVCFRYACLDIERPDGKEVVFIRK